jgi:hypothetical protein
MKTAKFIIATLALTLTLGAATAQTKVVPRYGEAVEKETGKLRSKIWVSDKGFRMETPRDDGGVNVIIFRTDSMTAYRLDPAKKTYFSFKVDVENLGLGGGELSGIEEFETVQSNVDRRLVGRETVEGVECEHYVIRRTDALKGGTTAIADREEWINPVDRIWRQQQDDIRPGSYLVHRKIVKGPQPAHLFEVPRDYTGSAMPAGGFMEALSGKSGGDPTESIGNNLDALRKMMGGGK